MVRKPSIKLSWRGKLGSKWRVWVVTTSTGSRHIWKSKSQAYRQYNAGIRLWKKKGKR